MAFFDIFTNRENMQFGIGREARMAQKMLDGLNENIRQDFGEKPEKGSELFAFVAAIEKEVKKRAKEWAMGLPKEGEEPPKMDAAVMFYVSADRMSAYACVLPPLNEGNPIAREQLLEEMRYEGISYGIDENVVTRIVEGQNDLRLVKIAEGTVPQDGKDGEIEELFERRQKRTIDIPEDAPVDQMDFREQGLLQPIRKGDVICRVNPPVPPQDGKDVTGRTLQGYGGERARVPEGENTALSEDGTSLLAQKDGILFMDRGDFCVLPQEIVEKKIDAEAGDQEYSGDVFIHGNIEGDVTVKAAGNIIIDGEVRGGRVLSGGTIQVYQAVKGSPGTRLKAERQVHCPVIEDAEVIAKGNIYAGVIGNSMVMSEGGSVFAALDRGLIFGGEVRANQSVSAKKIGNLSGCANKIMIGYVPELLDRQAELEHEMQEDRATLNRLRKTVSDMKALGMDTHRDKREGFAKLQEQKNLYEELDNQRTKELKELKKEIALSRGGKISCEELHPITEVAIGPLTMTVERDEKNCNVHMYAGRIVLK